MAHLEMNPNMIFLIVDPKDSNVEALKVNFKKIGYRNFICQSSGYEAINFIKKNKIDFVMCRLKMPAVSGPDLLSELKADFSIDRVPFMMFSEKMDEEDLALLTETGVDTYLTIPFMSKDLAEKIMASWSRYIDPNSIEFHFEKVRKTFLAGKLDDAERMFKDLEKSLKIRERAMLGRARVYQQRKELELALGVAVEITNEFPKYVHGHQLLGELSLQKGDLMTAIGSFSRAIEISPKNPYRYQVVCEILMNLKLWTQSEAILREAERRELAFPILEEAMATSLVNLERKEEAAEYFKKLVARDPKNVSYLNNIAVCYKGINNFNRAIKYYLDALTIEPRNTKIKYNLALVYFAKEKIEETKKELREILLMEPGFDKAKMKLLQIEDPQGYKRALIYMKNNEAKAASEQIIQPERVVSKVYENAESKIDKTKVASVISSSLDAAIASKVKAVKPINLDAGTIKKIGTLGAGAAMYGYLKSSSMVRKQLADVMGSWFFSVQKISEEIAVSVSEIAQSIIDKQGIDASSVGNLSAQAAENGEEYRQMLKRISETDSKLKDALMPVLMELQFQDVIRQTLDSIKESYQIIVQEPELEQIWDKVKETFVSIKDTQAFEMVVYGKVSDQEAEALSAGVVELF